VTRGIASVARLQREEVSRAKKEHEELVALLHVSTGGLHPLSNLQVTFDLANHMAKDHKSTGSCASFETHGKSNLIDNNGAPFGCFLFPTLPMASRIDGNGIFI
jgi:hypothetical protein